MNEFLQRLKQRKLVQLAVAYVAAAFALLQGIDIVAQRFAWPDAIERILIIASCIGFFVVLVLAWYHGERGAQKVTGTELLILALLLSLGGAFLWRFASASRAPLAASAVEPAAILASPAPAVAIPAKSIAVLPFENLSADKDNAYFASGMQDMILTKLAAIGELKVISRMSTERYKSHPDDLKVIAQQLGVATILEGSVQKAGDQVLINVQLIDAATDNHLWAEAYPRTLANIFGVEGEVAENVADALKAKLLPAESARVESVPTKDQAAYDLFLKGKYLFDKLQTSSAKDPVTTGNSASEFFQRATRADPEFALAYAWWSYLESYLHWYGVDNRSEATETARTAAEKALALQPDLPEAHLAMGYFHYWCHRDYPAALQEFEIARASLPNNADVLAAIGYIHRRQGAISRGIPELEQAMVLDPRDSTLPREIANSHTALRQYAEADQYYARSLGIVPDDLEAQEQRATNALFRGDLEAASRMLTAIPVDTDSQGSVSLLRFKLAMIQRRPDAALAAIAHSPDWLMTRWEHSVAPIGLLRGQALTMKGETALAHDAFLDAEKQLKELLANPGQVADANSYLGLVYAGLGEKELALKAARTAVEMLPMSRDVIVGIFYLDRLAQTEAQVGAASSAIDHLDQLMSSAGGETLSIATLRIDPAWDSLRKDPRFQKLLDGSDSTAKAATPST